VATLQVRDIDDRLYHFLKASAKLQNRSISQEVVTIIENYLNSSRNCSGNATAEFLAMAGAWKEEKSAKKIIAQIRKRGCRSRRFGGENGIFD
jgi:hypothetical protein